MDGLVGAEPIEVAGSAEDEDERGCERDGRGEQATDDAGGGVPNHGDGLHDRTWGDLAEGDGIEELVTGHPVVAVDGVGAHERMMTNPPP